MRGACSKEPPGIDGVQDARAYILKVIYEAYKARYRVVKVYAESRIDDYKGYLGCGVVGVHLLLLGFQVFDHTTLVGMA